MAERKSAKMSKITSDSLARSGTGCFIAVPLLQQWRQRVNSQYPTMNSGEVMKLSVLSQPIKKKIILTYKLVKQC